MGKKIILFFIATFSTSLLAIECPNLILECNYQVLNSQGTYQITQSKTTSFIGINTDEPSLPANECIAHLHFISIKKGDSLNITVRDDLLSFLYVGFDYGARNPQISLQASIDQEMTLHNLGEKMSCIIKSNSDQID